MKLPVVVANLDGDRTRDKGFIPTPLLDVNYFTVSVSFQPKIIQFALDNYVSEFIAGEKSGPHQYNADK